MRGIGRLGLGLIKPLSGAVVVAGPTWNAALNTASFTYSNGNNTATYAAAGPANQQARVSNAKSPSAYTGDFTVTPTYSGGLAGVGLIDPTNVNTAALVGNDVKDIALWSDGRVVATGGLVATYTGYTSGQPVRVRVVNGLLGFAVNSTWLNSYNPATGANGINISSGFNLATIVPAASVNTNGNVLLLDATNWV